MKRGGKDLLQMLRGQHKQTHGMNLVVWKIKSELIIQEYEVIVWIKK